MQNQMFYHLRPNKTVDRALFSELLLSLSNIINFRSYRYIGFGSFFFEDFKLLHTLLHIEDMISIERDHNIFLRQQKNLPLHCITPLNCKATEYIDEALETDKTSIVWLDYNSPKEITHQISNYCSLITRLTTNSIIRITMNASPASIKENPTLNGNDLRIYRLEELKNRLGDFLPDNVCSENLTHTNYPNLLLSILQKASFRYAANVCVQPLMTNVYADGQQMLTFTAILLEPDSEIKQRILDHLKHKNFLTLEWDRLQQISVPDLTIGERLSLNKLLPQSKAMELITSSNEFPGLDYNCIENYIKFYKYYPNYHLITL